jgi:hypothetical protein
MTGELTLEKRWKEGERKKERGKKGRNKERTKEYPG